MNLWPKVFSSNIWHLFFSESSSPSSLSSTFIGISMVLSSPCLSSLLCSIALSSRGGGQALHITDEDGGHHQHGGQVHTQGCFKEERLDEGGGKGDYSEKEGGGSSRLSSSSSSEQPCFNIPCSLSPNVCSLTSSQKARDKIHGCHVQWTHCHIYWAGLNKKISWQAQTNFNLPGCQRETQTIWSALKSVWV